ncbi:MAG: tetratricopeptide repeat protein [Bacteroidia bacterium]|nr:tetratricopeptide repeat protein [Bacteroidia bacterium]
MNTIGSTGNMTGLGLRVTVAGVGIVVFVLLLLADKSNLSSRKTQAITETGVVSEGGGSTAQLPPLAPDAQTDQLLARLEAAAPAAQHALLDSVVAVLSARKRYDVAAGYARQAAEADTSLSHLLTAGTLYQQALTLEHVSRDTVLRKQFGEAAIGYLSRVVAQDPRNEPALLSLGMAYITSGNPATSMQGILTIRKVLEINPANTAAGYQLGLFSVQTGQLDKAAERFEQVLKADPSMQEARYQLASVYVQTSRADQAKPLLEAVLRDTKDAALLEAARNLLTSLR